MRERPEVSDVAFDAAVSEGLAPTGEDQWAVAAIERAVRADERERIARELDAACLGRTAVRSLRWAGNNGRPLIGFGTDQRIVSTHVAGDLCGLADVVERLRAGES
jgi:hypothetical protein